MFRTALMRRYPFDTTHRAAGLRGFHATLDPTYDRL